MSEIHQIFVFEVAHSIDLASAERVLGGGSARHAFRHRGRSTPWRPSAACRRSDHLARAFAPSAP